MAPSFDLSQVDLMNFKVEYVRPQSGRAGEKNWINKTKDSSESLRCVCVSIDNLKASVKAIYSAKLTRTSKAVTYWDNTFWEIHHKLKKMKKSSLTYLSFRRPQWNPTATETKRKMPFVREARVAFFHTWSLTQLPTHFLEFYWFRILFWIRNFLAANVKGYNNSRLSGDIHRGSRQIHDKWLRFTCPSCT